ncbi:hypothetical protein OAG1_36830 [Agarivorans sp. OAG1]|nr:hypothetical protein OAG1_36830 [Agarivorans sp. OAG1]
MKTNAKFDIQKTLVSTESKAGLIIVSTLPKLHVTPRIKRKVSKWMFFVFNFTVPFLKKVIDCRCIKVTLKAFLKPKHE